MAALLPSAAYREAVELLAWLRLQQPPQQQQQGVQLAELEAAARELLSASKPAGDH